MKYSSTIAFLALVLLSAGFTCDKPTSHGKPCEKHDDCGPGRYCDPLLNTCVSGDSFLPWMTMAMASSPPEKFVQRLPTQGSEIPI